MSIQRQQSSSKLFFRVCLLFTLLFLHTATASIANEKSIQSFIDEAQPGDEIVIPRGIYHEAIIITKPLKIIAEDVVLRNNSKDVAIHIIADEVFLNGITIIHENENENSKAILIEGNENIVQYVTIHTLGIGVSLNNANRNIIEHLNIQRDQPINLATTSMGRRNGNGIDLYHSHENVLHQNTLVNLLDGIYIENSNYNIVEFNNAKNSRYGFHLMFTENTILSNNSATENITGAMIMSGSKATIVNNNFSKQSYHVHSQGLLLYDVHDAIIKGNILSENLIGLYLERSTNNEVTENKIIANFVGIQLKRVEENHLFHNDFLTNVIMARVTDSGNNIVRENYWDTHNGLDFTGDNLSNLAFNADPIFLSLVERKPPYQILNQSPGLLFIDLLFDKNEHGILRDNAPLLKPHGNEIAFVNNSKSSETFMYFLLLFLSIAIIFGGLRK